MLQLRHLITYFRKLWNIIIICILCGSCSLTLESASVTTSHYRIFVCISYDIALPYFCVYQLRHCTAVFVCVSVTTSHQRSINVKLRHRTTVFLCVSAVTTPHHRNINVKLLPYFKYASVTTLSEANSYVPL